MQNDTQLRVKAIEFASRTTQNPDTLIKTAQDIYSFIKGKENNPTFDIYEIYPIIEELLI